MARTSASLGMGIAVTTLGVLTFAGFISTLVFFGQKQKAERELGDLNSQISEFVRPDEQQRDDIRNIANRASDQSKSVVGYLNDALHDTTGKVTGQPRDTLDDFAQKLESAGVAEGATVLNTLRGRDSQVQDLTNQLAGSEAARSAAEQDLLNERERVERIRSEFEQQIAAMEQQVRTYRTDVDSYRSGIDQTEQAMDARLGTARSSARESEALLNDRIRTLESVVLTLRDTIGRLQQENAQSLPGVTDEFALVDGETVAVNGAAGEVFLSIGRREKVRLGMQFSVYAEPTSIRPDANGNYPNGKGFVEIIRIDDRSCTARIIRELPGNPIVAGDVIANPVFDPNKVYRLLVFGNFDVDGDGIATPFERGDLAARIREWGGQVLRGSQLTGDIDFLVLGSKPTLPPSPPSSAPAEVQLEYIRLRKQSNDYDRLLSEAKAMSLPVLNQNRLDTLLFGR